ncbi:MAG: ATP-binding cassette domain-containing protein [Proteobacteria bacterium]|nr:ATP-binding cassette domain-containing protein [Pseudomonadota bacterium]
MLTIKNLSVTLGEKSLLKNISFDVPAGARVLLRGANGSGKTTLAQTIAGNPEYNIVGALAHPAQSLIVQGPGGNAPDQMAAFQPPLQNPSIIFDGRDITNEPAATRALLGLFLGAQNVPEIPGLSVMSFLRHSLIAHRHFQAGKELSSGEFFQKLKVARERLNIPESWLTRSVNVGFSGGERKRLMFLRMILTQPKFAILDEPDSGADAEAQKLFADVIKEMNVTPVTSHQSPVTFLIISHQEKFTELFSPTAEIVLKNGEIVV